jgi:hypothetical protein
MNKENTKQVRNEVSGVIEDLTLNETAATQIKGGASDYLLELDGIKGESQQEAPVRRTR